ncbi:hypothetical protein C2134_02850 [Chromobacterium sinusclupearum]|uniref:HTH cro/C1-type domain-containing protein n=1 Tax=Chromobacterium sinusclupearum TaxID=2077146 RepID=A0A2K4MSR3_9NEIS|nr:helix-turn-helix domain-containing protein [Chromobacterium sinusclupearum]POB00147.1 hypothetical protein C2134_02850 [Chromobacterium sinusclupearum]
MLTQSSIKLAYMESWNIRLKQCLDEQKLKPSDLAKRVGVAPAAITQWTNSTTKTITGENLLKAAKVLKVAPEWLMFGTGPKTPNTPSTQAGLPDELQALLDDLYRAWLAKSLDANLISSLRMITNRLGIAPEARDMGVQGLDTAKKLGSRLSNPSGLNLDPKPTDSDKNGDLDAN